jgi:hypothetical protein
MYEFIKLQTQVSGLDYFCRNAESFVVMVNISLVVLWNSTGSKFLEQKISFKFCIKLGTTWTESCGNVESSPWKWHYGTTTSF